MSRRNLSYALVSTIDTLRHETCGLVNHQHGKRHDLDVHEFTLSHHWRPMGDVRGHIECQEKALDIW